MFLAACLCVGQLSAQRIAGLMQCLYERPEHVYQLLIADRADSILALATNEFRAVVTPQALTGVVTAVEEKLGKLQMAEQWTKKEVSPDYDTFVRQLLFGSYRVPLTVSFDRNNRVAGLQMGAPQIVDDNPLAENERELTVETDGFRMPARLMLPSVAGESPQEASRKWPCVVLVHGSGPSNMNEAAGAQKPFLDLARGLSERGIAVLRYDKRTFVYREKSVPAGKKSDYDAETVDDALSAVVLARRQAEVCADSVYVVGHSLGAMLAPRIAELDGKLAGIVCLAPPARKFREILCEQMAYLSGENEAQVKAQVDAVAAQLGADYMEMDERYSPVDVAKTLNIPMLVLRGERDYQVTSADFNLWKSGVGGRPNVFLKAYPRLNHFFTEGDGRPSPAEYNLPNHIPAFVLDDIATFLKCGKLIINNH